MSSAERRRVVVLGCALALCAGATAAPASVAGRLPTDCGKRSVVCTRVSVPLDWSGQRPGRLSLQASTRYFDIGEYGYWSLLFRGYTLVTFDPRGTGNSDPLRCRSTGIGSAGPTEAAKIAAACAERLGSRRAFFATSDNVKDIEAIRRALGFPRIGLYGASYGTDLALAYTRSFPDRVQRLLLDSVASPWSALPVLGQILRQIPSTLRAYCAGVCADVTNDYGREVVMLANSLAAKPLRGLVVQPDGGRRAERLDGMRLLELVIETDLDPGLAAELPAAVHAARQGDARPLLRLAELVDRGKLDPVYVATSCDDGPFPWQSDTPIAQRPALLRRASADLPKGSLGGFGPWAIAAMGNASLCLMWPPSPLREAPASATYPNVPMLAVSGALDLRSPTGEARALLPHFPSGRLLTVTNAGHAALASTFSTCTVEAVRSWVGGRNVPRSCHSPRLLAPLAAFPSVHPGAERPATAAATLALVTKTIQEAEASWLIASYEAGADALPGLAAGRLTNTHRGFMLSGYSLVDGLSLNGSLDAHVSAGPTPLRFNGLLRVKRGAATIGALAVNGNMLDGRLQGRAIVGGRVAAATPTTVGSGGQAWSAWTPPSGSTAEVANAIASHVAGEYRLDAAGTQLLAVRTGPPTAPRGAKRPIFAVAVQSSRYSRSNAEVHLASDTWTYTLCGASARCALAGEATVTRGRLVRREALETALYAFRYAPQLSSLLVYLPPPPGQAPTTLLYFERSRLAAQLLQPLEKTLPLASPPLPSDLDTSEAQTIDSLTLPYMYTYSVVTLTGGSTELTLTPAT